MKLLRAESDAPPQKMNEHPDSFLPLKMLENGFEKVQRVRTHEARTYESIHMFFKGSLLLPIQSFIFM